MFEKFLLKDTSGKKSTTLTVFILGAVIVHLKLLFSGITIGGLTLSDFSGVDFAAAMGALGGIYVMRRSTDAKVDEILEEPPGGE